MNTNEMGPEHPGSDPESIKNALATEMDALSSTVRVDKRGRNGVTAYYIGEKPTTPDEHWIVAELDERTGQIGLSSQGKATVDLWTQDPNEAIQWVHDKLRDRGNE
jgi:hypothetical protein